MLTNIQCSVIPSIKVDLTFDTGVHKERTISVNDLIDVTFNHNGCRKQIEGKVIKISTNGTDPKYWYIIVDASEDYDSAQYRFAPTNILDVDIILKDEETKYIYSTDDFMRIRGFRWCNGFLQFTQDGATWQNAYTDPNSVIEDESGTSNCNCENNNELKDEVNE